MTIKAVQQKIIDLLAADTSVDIKSDHWFYGPPLTRNDTPFGFVVWKGGPLQIEAYGHKLETFDFEVVIVDSSDKENEAEQSTEDRIEAARLVLDSNNTLAGLVRDSNVVSMTGDVVLAGTDWGKIEQIIAAGKLVLRVDISKDLRG